MPAQGSAPRANRAVRGGAYSLDGNYVRCAMRSLHPELIAQGASAISFARTLGGATGVSLCGIVLQWRLSVHGDDLTRLASSPARLAAFNESFLMLSALCLLALVAAWQLREPVPGQPR